MMGAAAVVQLLFDVVGVAGVVSVVVCRCGCCFFAVRSCLCRVAVVAVIVAVAVVIVVVVALVAVSSVAVASAATAMNACPA